MLMMTMLAAVLLNPSVEVACERPAGWSFAVTTVETEPATDYGIIRVK